MTAADRHLFSSNKTVTLYTNPDIFAEIVNINYSLVIIRKQLYEAKEL